MYQVSVREIRSPITIFIYLFFNFLFFFNISALVFVHAIPPPIVPQKTPQSQVLNLSESLFLFNLVTDKGINYQTEKSCVKTQVYFMLVLW